MDNRLKACVFCGAQSGKDPMFREATEALGRGLAQRNITLIYGGGQIGLMGAVADATLKAGGAVVGVIPEFLTQWEVAHTGVAEMIVTDTMHSRKRRMFDLSDVFISMPGGLGTLDETFEILTWRQLRRHDKPILIVNIAGSASALVALIESCVTLGFAKPEIRELYEVFDSVDAVLAHLDHIGDRRQPRNQDAVATI